MKAKVILTYFLMLVLGVMVFLVVGGTISGKKSSADEKALPQDARIEDLGCYANVPEEGRTFIPIQFQASATEDDSPGGLVSIDYIVGKMRFVPPTNQVYGFEQGSPIFEPGRGNDEDQFDHILTRNIAVMETEVMMKMWEDLQDVQPTLPDDPSGLDYGWGDTNPVHNVTWNECILFANLLSIENGFIPCYYTDSSFETPVDASNYQGDEIYCYFTANGYRLPTEGEWEYFARAGTTTPFYVIEPDYDHTTKQTCTTGVLLNLEAAAIFCANDQEITEPACTRLTNTWNLCDIHGNVAEWCWDGYGAYPTGIKTDYDGSGASDKVYRGGAWSSYPMDCRSANRSGYPGYDCLNIIGFRLVRSLVY